FAVLAGAWIDQLGDVERPTAALRGDFAKLFGQPRVVGDHVVVVARCLAGDQFDIVLVDPAAHTQSDDLGSLRLQLVRCFDGLVDVDLIGPRAAIGVASLGSRYPVCRGFAVSDEQNQIVMRGIELPETAVPVRASRVLGNSAEGIDLFVQVTHGIRSDTEVAAIGSLVPSGPKVAKELTDTLLGVPVRPLATA